MRGPNVSYGLLKLTPVINTAAYSFDVERFTLRHGNDRINFEDLTLAQALNTAARNDILLTTFENDPPDRLEALEIEFEIPEYDERVSINFRVAEYEAIPEILFFEVEDAAGDWIPVEDVTLLEMLSHSFMHTLEASVINAIDDHSLEMLPLAAE